MTKISTNKICSYKIEIEFQYNDILYLRETDLLKNTIKWFNTINGFCNEYKNNKWYKLFDKECEIPKIEIAFKQHLREEKLKRILKN